MKKFMTTVLAIILTICLQPASSIQARFSSISFSGAALYDLNIHDYSALTINRDQKGNEVWHDRWYVSSNHNIHLWLRIDFTGFDVI
ncbi:MAG TPA: hypothetical protein DCM45_02485 [Clostridiales bacterium]|nr:hypothetical protein [Clostridiales bacterium]